MKLLKKKDFLSLETWTRRVVCGPIPDGPQIQGCGSWFEISGQDIFKHRSINTIVVLWQCPECCELNLLDPNNLPQLKDIPTRASWLDNRQKSLLNELIPLVPEQKRLSYLFDLVDEDIISARVFRNYLEDPSVNV